MTTITADRLQQVNRDLDEAIDILTEGNYSKTLIESLRLASQLLTARPDDEREGGEGTE